MSATGESALRVEIARVRSGTGDGQSLMEAFRDAVVLLPQTTDDSVVAGDYGGLRWLYVFTSEAELASWVEVCGGDGAAEQPYMAVRGHRVLDAALPGVGVPAGVALDVAGAQPMFLPPVQGIVSDQMAVA